MLVTSLVTYTIVKRKETPNSFLNQIKDMQLNKLNQIEPQNSEIKTPQV